MRTVCRSKLVALQGEKVKMSEGRLKIEYTSPLYEYWVIMWILSHLFCSEGCRPSEGSSAGAIEMAAKKRGMEMWAV